MSGVKGKSGVYIRTKPSHWKGKKRLEFSRWLKENHPRGMKGKIHNLETKRKMSKFAKGRIFSKEHKENLSIAHKGQIPWCIGLKLSDIHRKRLSESHKTINPLCKTKERIKLYNQRNRKRRRMAGELTLQTIQRVYEDNIKKYGTLTCYLCLKLISFGKDSLEHKIPISRGGTNLYENLAIAHKGCNSKKSTKTEKEFRKNEL